MTDGLVFCGACGARIGAELRACPQCGELQQPLEDQRPTAPDLEVVAPALERADGQER